MFWKNSPFFGVFTRPADASDFGPPLFERVVCSPRCGREAEPPVVGGGNSCGSGAGPPVVRGGNPSFLVTRRTAFWAAFR